MVNKTSTFLLVLLVASQSFAYDLYTSFGKIDCDGLNSRQCPRLPYSSDLMIFKVAADPQNAHEGLWGLTYPVDGVQEFVRFLPESSTVLERVPIESLPGFNGLTLDPLSGDFVGYTATEFFKIDRQGQRTTLSLGVPPFALNTWNAIAFDSQGVLYGADIIAGQNSELFRMNATSGEFDSLGVIDGRIQGLAFHPATGALTSLSYGDDGTGRVDYGLFSIDIVNRVANYLGAAPSRSSGLAYVSVPEPTCLPVLAMIAFPILRRKSKFVARPSGGINCE